MKKTSFFLKLKKNKTMTKKEYYEFEKTLKKDVVYSGCETFKIIDDYFKQSYKYAERSKNGVKAYVFKNNKNWHKENYCIHLIDNLGNEIHFSKNISKSPPKNKEKDEVLRAFRQTIYPEIKQFKKKFIAGFTKCELSGVVLTKKEDAHVDHYDYDFIEVVYMFMKKYNKTFKDLHKYVLSKKTIRTFDNEKYPEQCKYLKKYFIEFHNQNTKLRFLSAEENLKRTKQQLCN